MDTNFDILIRAIYDKKSGDKAASDLEREVVSALGSDRIEIPLALSKKFSKNIGKEIRTAQQDTMESLDKVLRKGLSSSNEELEDFAKKYEKFLKLLDKNKSPQSQSRLAQLKGLGATEAIKSYNSYMKALQKAQDKWTADIKEKEVKKQRLKGVKRVGPKGFKRDVGFDSGVATKKTVQESDFSPYRSNWARQMKISELASIKWMQESLKSYKDNEAAEKFASNAITIGGNKKILTEQEKSLEKSENVSNQLAKILGGLEHNRPDASVEKFNQYLEGLLKFNEGSDKNIWDGVLLALNKTFNRYASKGAIGTTDGTTRGEAEGHANAMHALAGMINTFKKALEQDVVIKINEKELQVSQEQLRALKQLGKVDPRAAEKEVNAILQGNKIKAEKKSKNTVVENSQLQKELDNMTKEQKTQNNLTKKQNQADAIEHSRESVADSTLKDIEKTDAEDGANSESNFQELLSKFDGLNSIFDGCPCEAILKAISNNVKLITDVITKKEEPKTEKDVENWSKNLPALVESEDVRTIKKVGRPKKVRRFVDKTDEKALRQKMAIAQIEREREQIEQGKHPSQQRSRLQRSIIETSLMDFSKKLPKLFSQKLVATTSKEQDQLNADLMRRYGIGASEGPSNMGDKLKYARRRSLFGYNAQLEKVFKDFKLTPGIKIDTTEITKEIAKVMSGAEMFKAQSGGWKNNLAIAMTGGVASRFQPSLEKTRAQADAINTAMADMRNAFNDVIQDILDKESILADMEAKGDISFDAEGKVASGTEDARFTAGQLEESKKILASLLADAGMVKEVVEETGGDLGEILKMLGFTSPMLRKDNKYIANINAGLDKTGKALKFQRRDQEIINYAFQRMGRYIGQAVSRFMLMLNPINLIKKAFSDFASYDVKWQRTMNVIKYNIRRIIKPFMEWLAQQIVNIIGLVNALVKGLGQAFGQNWDLFDQAAANTEKMEEDFEKINNITAGFDELHDIGSDNSAENDLLGDIYKPQWGDLYKSVEDFGKNIVDAFENIKKTVEGWNFWDWLIIGATAIGGFLALKWLIDLFGKGKNPMQSVADGFKSLEKSVGWALLVWAFSSLVDSLKEFIDVVGQMESQQVGQALIGLAGALAIVGAIIGALLIMLSALAEGVAPGILALAALVAAIGLVIYAYAELMRATGDFIDALGRNKDEVIEIIHAVGDEFVRITLAVGLVISNVFETVGNTITRIIDKIISKITELITAVVTGIGGTIKDIIRTVGDVIIEVINSITDAIPKLLNSILNFCWQIGPAIENSVNAVMRSVTKLINFIISAVEYMINTLLIGSINGLLSKIPFVGGTLQIGQVNIPRFVPKYEKGTNYVPNNGLAYLHQGEAVIPKKYNQPYQQGISAEERAYMEKMIQTMNMLDGTIKEGINVKGQFVQKGNDLVATVQKANNKLSNNILNNKVYAR